MKNENLVDNHELRLRETNRRETEGVHGTEQPHRPWPLQPVIQALFRANRGLLVALLCFGIAGPAGASSEDERFQLRPIVTRYAKTASKIFGDITFKYFTEQELQEADDFDGWGLNIDLTIPFRHNMQLYLLLPIYTDGDADVIETGEKTDIDGYGGTFDFGTLFFEHQVMQQSDWDLNLGYYFGLGHRTDELDTDSSDRYNHRGRNVHLGLRADRYFSARDMRLLGNLGARYYYDTDDLNPQGDDAFWLFEVNTAVVFKPWLGRIYPAAELIYHTIDLEFNQLSLMPELIVPATSFLELKVGGVIPLTSDGEQWGARFQLTGRF